MDVVFTKGLRLNGNHAIALDPHRPGPERLAGAGAGDADAVAAPKQRPVRGAEDQVALAGQETPGDVAEREAGVWASPSRNRKPLAPGSSISARAHSLTPAAGRAGFTAACRQSA